MQAVRDSVVVEAEQPPAGRAAASRFSSWAYLSYVLCLCTCSNIVPGLSLPVTSGQSPTRVHLIFESHVFTFKNLFSITNLSFKMGRVLMSCVGRVGGQSPRWTRD